MLIFCLVIVAAMLVLMACSAISSEVRLGNCQNALRAAHHELTTLHGLWASDAPNHHDIWQIDAGTTLEKIDAALELPPYPDNLCAGYAEAGSAP